MGDLKEGTIILGNWASDWYEKNKSHFWTGVSMVATGATAYASAKDTARVFRKCAKKYGCDPSELPVKERLTEYWKEYAGTAACASLAIFGAGKSDLDSTKKIAGLTTDYVVLSKAHQMLKKNLKEVVGEKKARQVEDKTAQEQVTQHVTQERVDRAPVIGRGDQVFMDGYSKILFKSNIDYLRMCEMKLQNMMAELAPRGDEFDYYDRKIGVPYSEWLAFIGVPKSEYNTPERMDHGWNKGFAKDGSDDDPIAFYTTTTEYEEGKSCIVINWEKDPTDMKLGRLMKSSGL